MSGELTDPDETFNFQRFSPLRLDSLNKVSGSQGKKSRTLKTKTMGGSTKKKTKTKTPTSPTFSVRTTELNLASPARPEPEAGSVSKLPPRTHEMSDNSEDLSDGEVTLPADLSELLKKTTAKNEHVDTTMNGKTPKAGLSDSKKKASPKALKKKAAASKNEALLSEGGEPISSSNSPDNQEIGGDTNSPAHSLKKADIQGGSAKKKTPTSKKKVAEGQTGVPPPGSSDKQELGVRDSRLLAIIDRIASDSGCSSNNASPNKGTNVTSSPKVLTKKKTPAKSRSTKPTAAASVAKAAKSDSESSSSDDSDSEAEVGNTIKEKSPPTKAVPQVGAVKGSLTGVESKSKLTKPAVAVSAAKAAESDSESSSSDSDSESEAGNDVKANSSPTKAVPTRGAPMGPAAGMESKSKSTKPAAVSAAVSAAKAAESDSESSSSDSDSESGVQNTAKGKSSPTKAASTGGAPKVPVARAVSNSSSSSDSDSDDEHIAQKKLPARPLVSNIGTKAALAAADSSSSESESEDELPPSFPTTPKTVTMVKPAASLAHKNQGGNAASLKSQNAGRNPPVKTPQAMSKETKSISKPGTGRQSSSSSETSDSESEADEMPAGKVSQVPRAKQNINPAADSSSSDSESDDETPTAHPNSAAAQGKSQQATVINKKTTLNTQSVPASSKSITKSPVAAAAESSSESESDSSSSDSEDEAPAANHSRPSEPVKANHNLPRGPAAKEISSSGSESDSSDSESHNQAAVSPARKEIVNKAEGGQSKSPRGSTKKAVESSSKSPKVGANKAVGSSKSPRGGVRTDDIDFVMPQREITPESRSTDVPPATDAPAAQLRYSCDGFTPVKFDAGKKSNMWLEDVAKDVKKGNKEFWLISVPPDTDKDMLDGQTLLMDAMVTLPVETKSDMTWHIQATSNKVEGGMAVLMPSKKDGQLHLAGRTSAQVFLAKSVRLQPSVIPESIHTPPAMPTGLKMRNIPFGSGTPVRGPALPASTDPPEKSSKKKEKKTKKRMNMETAAPAESVDNTDVKKKKKKKKVDMEDGADAGVGLLVNDVTPTETTKKRKRPKEDQSAEQIPRTPSDDAPPKKKKKKSDVDTSKVNSPDNSLVQNTSHKTPTDDAPPKKKKKKSDVNTSEVGTPDNSLVQNTSHKTPSDDAPPKKKKKKSDVNASKMETPDNSLVHNTSYKTPSDDAPPKKKKKKSDVNTSKVETPDNSLVQNTSHDLDNSSSTSSKTETKKHKKQKKKDKKKDGVTEAISPPSMNISGIENVERSDSAKKHKDKKKKKKKVKD